MAAETPRARHPERTEGSISLSGRLAGTSGWFASLCMTPTLIPARGRGTFYIKMPFPLR